MRARAAAVAMLTLGVAALGALAACRGVLGIEDVKLVDGGESADAAGDGGAQSEASTSDSGAADAGADASTCETRSTDRSSCFMCCAQEQPAGAGSYFAFAERGDSCACQTCSNACTSAMKVCGGSTSMAQTPCGGCVTNLEVDDRCATLAAECNGDAQCATWAACIKTCAPLPR